MLAASLDAMREVLDRAPRCRSLVSPRGRRRRHEIASTRWSSKLQTLDPCEAGDYTDQSARAARSMPEPQSIPGWDVAPLGHSGAAWRRGRGEPEAILHAGARIPAAAGEILPREHGGRRAEERRRRGRERDRPAVPLLRRGNTDHPDTAVRRSARRSSSSSTGEPPIGAPTRSELPAGLGLGIAPARAGESPQGAPAAAPRPPPRAQLEEETGYTGTVSLLSEEVCMSPGLCDETVQVVVVDVEDEAIRTRPRESRPGAAAGSGRVCGRPPRPARRDARGARRGRRDADRGLVPLGDRAGGADADRDGGRPRSSITRSRRPQVRPLTAACQHGRARQRRVAETHLIGQPPAHGAPLRKRSSSRPLSDEEATTARLAFMPPRRPLACRRRSRGVGGERALARRPTGRRSDHARTSKSKNRSSLERRVQRCVRRAAIVGSRNGSTNSGG